MEAIIEGMLRAAEHSAGGRHRELGDVGVRTEGGGVLSFGPCLPFSSTELSEGWKRSIRAPGGCRLDLAWRPALATRIDPDPVRPPIFTQMPDKPDQPSAPRHAT